MSGLEADTIGGFNSMIAKQKKANGEALISTVLFDLSLIHIFLYLSIAAQAMIASLKKRFQEE